MFTEMCCVEGFSDAFPNQFYQDAGGALDIVPATGFFLNAIVGVSAPPDNEEVIARNGSVASEGWELVMFDPGVGTPSVNFRFRVYDAGGPIEVIPTGSFSLDPTAVLNPGLTNFPDRIFFRISCAFYPAGGSGGAFGTIQIRVEGFSFTAAALTAAYVNTTPLLLVGSDTLRAFEVPNCIHGIAGGTCTWPVGDISFLPTVDAWAASVGPYDISSPTAGFVSDTGSYQLEPMPDPLSVGVTNTNGWRANYPELPQGDAPSPFLPFIGATPLLYANGPPSGALTVTCSQPSVFWSEIF